MPEIPDDPEQYHLEQAGEGPLFGATSGTSMGQSFGTDAGLIAGDREDAVLFAGVGYPLLGDMALGTVLAHRVARWDLPGVAVADCSHTPIAAYQTITDGGYEAALLVGAEKRGGELNDGQPSANPGALHEYGPDEIEAPEDRLVDLIGQTAMGLNTLENVVIVTKTFGEFPEHTTILAVEPEYDSWGPAVDEFTAPVEAALETVTDRVLELLDHHLAEVDPAPER